MPDAVLVILAQVVIAVLLIVGTWVIRGIWDQHKADVRRDTEWDRACGTGRDDG